MSVLSDCTVPNITKAVLGTAVLTKKEEKLDLSFKKQHAKSFYPNADGVLVEDIENDKSRKPRYEDYETAAKQTVLNIQTMFEQLKQSQIYQVLNIISDSKVINKNRTYDDFMAANFGIHQIMDYWAANINAKQIAKNINAQDRKDKIVQTVDDLNIKIDKQIPNIIQEYFGFSFIMIQSILICLVESYLCTQNQNYVPYNEEFYDSIGVDIWLEGLHKFNQSTVLTMHDRVISPYIAQTIPRCEWPYVIPVCWDYDKYF